MNCVAYLLDDDGKKYARNVLSYKCGIYHMVDNSDCHSKVKGTSPVTCYFTSSKQCHKKFSHYSQAEHNTFTPQINSRQFGCVVDQTRTGQRMRPS